MKDTIFINVKAGPISRGMYNVVMQIDVDEPNVIEKDIITSTIARVADGAVKDCKDDDLECNIHFAECGKTFQAMTSPEELPKVFYVTDVTNGYCDMYTIGEVAQGWAMMVLNGYKGV